MVFAALAKTLHTSILNIPVREIVSLLTGHLISQTLGGYHIHYISLSIFDMAGY